jgi:hypothetical protein
VRDGNSDSLQDVDYIKKYYTIEYDKNQAVKMLGGRDETERVKKGENDFKPWVELSSFSLKLC